jgi:hypothetical protein
MDTPLARHTVLQYVIFKPHHIQHAVSARSYACADAPGPSWS